MNKALYRLVAWGLRELVWDGYLLGAEELPERGPAVFVSNHLGALGPIAVGATLPFYLHAWVHADMLDPRLAPDYLRRDFVERQLHLKPPFSAWLARGISHVHIPLMRAVGCVPVYHTPDGLLETMRLSLDLLLRGEYLLIYPEDPDLPVDPRYQMTPFKKGFARLGKLYYERSKQVLSFYPLAVHARSASVRVGRPVRYSPLGSPLVECLRVKNLIERAIHEMYLHADEGEIIHLPLSN